MRCDRRAPAHERRDIGLRTDLSGAGDLQEIYDRIARERAGQLEPRPPEQWSLAEELIRHHAEARDQLETAIADVIGPERARPRPAGPPRRLGHRRSRPGSMPAKL